MICQSVRSGHILRKECFAVGFLCISPLQLKALFLFRILRVKMLLDGLICDFAYKFILILVAVWDPCLAFILFDLSSEEVQVSYGI